MQEYMLSPLRDRNLILAGSVAALGVAIALPPRRPQFTTHTTHRIGLVSDAHGNEALVVAAYVDGTSTLFLIDTAYAGAPVLSTSLLGAFRPLETTTSSLESRYRSALAASRSATDTQRATAVRKLLRSGRCRAFTSGCTMRLMGIGETTETQADMLLCPSIALDGHIDAALDADVLVTNPLQGSPHILTIDFLLHRHPVVLCPREQTLRTRLSHTEMASLAPTFHFFPARFVGGAPTLPVRVGDVMLHVVMDTGAAAPLSLGAHAAERVRTCTSAQMRAMQVGVHGERICSDVLQAEVRVGTLDLGTVAVHANTQDVQGADGYMGMGVLRALTLCLEPHRIGVRLSGLPTRNSQSTSKGSCDRPRPLKCTV